MWLHAHTATPTPPSAARAACTGRDSSRAREGRLGRPERAERRGGAAEAVARRARVELRHVGLESSSAHTSFAAPVDGISHDHTSSSKALRLHSTSFATSASAVSFFSFALLEQRHVARLEPRAALVGSGQRDAERKLDGLGEARASIADVPLRSVSVVRFEARARRWRRCGHPRGLRPYWTICTSTSPPPPASAISPGAAAPSGASSSPLSLRPSPSSSSSSSVVRSVAASARQTRRESELSAV